MKRRARKPGVFMYPRARKARISIAAKGQTLLQQRLLPGL